MKTLFVFIKKARLPIGGAPCRDLNIGFAAWLRRAWHVAQFQFKLMKMSRLLLNHMYDNDVLTFYATIVL
ncbi:MAG TPA: hypothetical protein VFW25_10235 [Silvibacterium sp.]|nr:hypothetical protein [Silvibacterium sp.]